MASRQFSAGATVKHLKIIQIDQEFLKSEEVERRRKVPRLDRWKGGPAETLYKRVRLLAAAIGRVQPRQKRDAICRRLWLRMKTNNTLPDRFAGKDASPNNPKPWDPDTFEGYLRGLKTNPKEHEEQLILAELKALLTSRFEEVGRVGDSIDIIFSSTYPLPSDYLLALLGSAAEEPDHVFAPGPEYVSVRGKGFESEPVAAWPHPLEMTATEIVEAIKRADGAGLALVSGPHMSGKKTCLKFLCRAIDDGLRLDSGERVPYLALALDELEPGEFLDTVLAFYRRGDPAPSSLNRDTGLSSAAKIKEIFRIAETCPACLILADLDPVESDAVLRSLHQDHVSQVLLGLFSGHAATRLVLTGRATGGLAALVREARRRGIRSKTFELTDRLRVDLDTFAVVTDGENGRDVGAFTYQVAMIAERLAADRKLRQGRSIHRSLERDDRATILQTLWEKILRPYERFLLGAVACTPEGLRASVLARMALSMLSSDGADWLHRLTNPDQVEAIARDLADIVQVRNTVPDLGQRGFREVASEPLLFLDQGWRRQLQRMWFDTEPDLARHCSWLIAREAAQQARVLKMRGGIANSRSAFARDIQAFVALITSVDVQKVREKAAEDRFWPLESAVLPELDEHATYPDERTVLRYAFLRLYRDYLEGSGYRLLQQMADPDLRLRVLLPFFDPTSPWLAAHERDLGENLDEYEFLSRSFSPREFLELLTAVALAALKLQRYGLLRSAVRLGEQILSREKDPVLYPRSVRLLRTEIDAGIYAGGNPGLLLPERPGEQSVRSRQSGSEDDGRLRRKRAGRSAVTAETDYTYSYVLNLIQKARALFPNDDPSVDAAFARGKILARLGEAYFMAGLVSRSELALRQALYAEKRIANIEGTEAASGSVLGGRGARAFIAVLIETAKRKTWIKDKNEIALKSGLRLPLPPVVNELDGRLALARAMLALNIRRVDAIGTADRLGLRIDQALLAAAQGDYLSATDMLEQIEEAPLHRGTNAELAMEMTSQRARIYMEAATLMMHHQVGQAKWPVSFWMGELRKKLKEESKADRFDPIRELILRAESSLSALRELVKSADAHTLPIGSVFRYLTVGLDILKTRELEGADARTALKSTHWSLERVLGHFDEAQFLRYEPEAKWIHGQLAAFT